VTPPALIDGARVLEWAWSETPFGEVGDIAIHGLALCQYDGSTQVYRFSCDAAWSCQQDALYDSVEEAKQALPAQYRRVEAEWRKAE
jgi:hypothetical protein